MINDGNGNAPTYDAENRILTDAGVTYAYDADGIRVKKTSGTMYWPSPGGEILAETDISGNINEEYIYFNGKRLAWDAVTGLPVAPGNTPLPSGQKEAKHPLKNLVARIDEARIRKKRRRHCGRLYLYPGGVGGHVRIENR